MKLTTNEMLKYRVPNRNKRHVFINEEYLFFFTKSRKYYFELQFEPSADRLRDIKSARETKFRYHEKYEAGYDQASMRNNNLNRSATGQPIENPDIGRNKRCVWTISTKPYPVAHFAVYPHELVETPFIAACSEYICKNCGKPKKKIFQEIILQKQETLLHYGNKYRNTCMGQTLQGFVRSNLIAKDREESRISAKECFPDDPEAQEDYVNRVHDHGCCKKVESSTYSDCGCNAGWDAGIVLDSFACSNTTLKVARKLGRNTIGIEIRPAYGEIIKKRLNQEVEVIDFREGI